MSSCYAQLDSGRVVSCLLKQCLYSKFLSSISCILNNILIAASPKYLLPLRCTRPQAQCYFCFFFFLFFWKNQVILLTSSQATLMWREKYLKWLEVKLDSGNFVLKILTGLAVRILSEKSVTGGT